MTYLCEQCGAIPEMFCTCQNITIVASAKLPDANEQQDSFMRIARRRYPEEFVPAAQTKPALTCTKPR